MRRGLRGVVLVGLLIGLLVSGSPVNAVASSVVVATGRHTYTGTIDGADFRVETPQRWNGTLVLFSHGNWPVGFPPPGGIWLANRPPDRSRTEAWLLDHGYALAASNFKGVTGFAMEHALQDQIALLDWFEANIGRPHRTVATGHSNGAAISALLAERNPHRFAGVATACGEFDPHGTLNTALDMLFAVKTLLVPADQQDIELVRSREPDRGNEVLTNAVRDAMTTQQGRARIALIAALGNIPGAFSAHEPAPLPGAEDWVRKQADWIGAYIFFGGPKERSDLERRAGGNPSFNTGIDYRRLLTRSVQTELVRRAYAATPGADLNADLDRLDTAPRIAADPVAVAYMYRFAVPTGRISIPFITLHTEQDGGAVSEHERWYAGQVRRHGDPAKLRQVYVDRGMHCAFSDAEELVSLRALFERIDTGRWPNLAVHRLNAAAREFPDPYHLVLDFGTFQDKLMPPAFTDFTPAQFLRPSR
ncbi:MAG TPA: hypothetical protein VF062_07610 [Candidatus Limnocylindrales bacterium]